MSAADRHAGFLTADRAIRFLTALIVVALGAAAAIVSYSHALVVATANGQHGWTATLTPLTIDGLVLVAGLVLLDGARRGQTSASLVLAYVTLGLGIAATLAVNVLYGIGHGPTGAVVAGWPAVALVLSTELLMGMIRRGQRPTTPGMAPGVEGEATLDVAPSQGDTSHDTASGSVSHEGDMPPGDAEAGEVPSGSVTPLPTADQDADSEPLPSGGVVSDAERALALLADDPGITGAELGRRLGLSARQGQRLLASLRPRHLREVKTS